MPAAAGAYPRRGSFALLDFADDDDPPVAYVGGPAAARYFDTPDGRAEYEYVWQVLLDKSINIEGWT
ncbi:Scr1 family TA system antitoxin-like transcriptional regulator [Pseudonocardia lacus]|uniref:Scr1 family TA system antitoxin-like transcriptional regulator n=1 Tax=Pseudonocardia lacus TaxID=2835865 RepID=UPI0038B495BE